jgi:hypothetical protein
MKKLTPLGEVDSTEELRKQVAELTKMVEALSKSTAEPKQPRVAKTKEMIPNEYVKVMSLVGNKLNLSTRPRGTGKTFSFNAFGDVQTMFYSELLDIINNHPNFFEAGYFYVMDPRVIAMGNYYNTYQKILTKDQIEQILANAGNALELFETANTKQQKVIVDFLIEKIVTNQPVDFNLISKISDLSEINILQRAQEIKENNSVEKK